MPRPGEANLEIHVCLDRKQGQKLSAYRNELNFWHDENALQLNCEAYCRAYKLAELIILHLRWMSLVIYRLYFNKVYSQLWTKISPEYGHSWLCLLLSTPSMTISYLGYFNSLARIATSIIYPVGSMLHKISRRILLKYKTFVMVSHSILNEPQSFCGQRGPACFTYQ